MKKFKNTKKDNFLASIPKESLDSDKQDIADRCKFNFSYFDNSQKVGQDFKDWNKEQLVKFLNKLKEYCKFSLKYWKKQPIGKAKKRKTVYANYGTFPRKSDFTHPKHIPHQAEWGRFRLEDDMRLIGFVIPNDYKGKKSKKGFYYDINTFYIVFLDEKHNFYKSEKR
ncbi:hypothetical protein QUF72_10010 [Desulfobacterales bacterium HSG2]|nr:hypothetical protein [Desulfobacterales bacterium HSG2]